MSYSSLLIAKILNAKTIGFRNDSIKFLIYDSRSIFIPKNSIFLAIKTKKNDGHNYIADAYNKGIRNFIISDYHNDYQKLKDSFFILVEDTINALQYLATFHREKFNIPILAITGSNGKTIVKEWFSELASEKTNICKNPKSFNSQIGVPLSVWLLNKNNQMAVFEAGISKPNEMDKLEKIISPKVGLITNIGDAHQENFISLEQKIDEKLKLFKNAETIIFPKDSPLLYSTITQIFKNKKLFTWSFKQKSNLQIINIKKNKNISELTILYKGKIYKKKLNFTDNALIENAVSTLSALLVMFEDSDPDNHKIETLTPVKMRLEQIEAINNCTIINDSYNSDLTSLQSALEVLNSQKQHVNKTLILSDIYEVGMQKKELYSTVAQLCKKTGITKFIGIGKEISFFSDLFTCNSKFYTTTQDFLNNFYSFLPKNETILIKGARKFNFENIVEKLQLKNHTTILEVNLKAIKNNLHYFRNLVKSKTKMMIMVKAFSYGNGSYEIANLLQKEKVDYLAVAIVDEGIQLRKAGITLPILILNPHSTDFQKLIDYNLEPEIYNFSILNKFYKTIKNNIIQPYPVHIKIDTGMNRLGFKINDIDKLINELKNKPEIFVKSIFSHLAGSPSKKFDNFTVSQIKNFQRIADIISNSLGYKPLRHILNSAGIERFPQYQMDMVRLGIGLYGISAKENNNLEHISTLKTKIVHISKVRVGESVGYDRSWTAKRNSQIATIPVGYADGLDRRLSNGVGKVLVNGNIVPIVGKICMDLTMIDVTDLDISIGDEVIIFNNKLTISQIAKSIGTIPYEILTMISPRVKRIYVWE